EYGANGILCIFAPLRERYLFVNSGSSSALGRITVARIAGRRYYFVTALLPSTLTHIIEETVHAELAESPVCGATDADHRGGPRRILVGLVRADGDDSHRNRPGCLVSQDEVGADVHRVQPGMDHLRRLRAGDRR